MAQPPRHTFDAANPDVHDPVMARGEDGRYYIFSTGMGISVMSSSDMKTWRQEKSVFSVKAKMPDGREFSVPGCTPIPSWTTDSIHGFHGHIWAPDISYHPSHTTSSGQACSGQDGKWYLYYSCSTFGKNGSAIGLATNKTLDPLSPYFKWEDQGCVIVSHRNKDDYNCIDPNLITQQSTNTQHPTPNTLIFGSFWDGIQMMPLDADMKTPLSHPVTIARRHAPASNQKTADPFIEVVGNDTVEAGDNAIEAPFVIYNDGWYYLFVSWDYCCRGRNSTYKTVYGRSRSITGPYLDKDGKDMATGGGTYLVGPDDKYYGIGHCAAYQLPTPATNTRYPATNTRHPATNTRYPATNTRYPATNTRHQATNTRYPATNTRQWYFISHAYDISKDGQSKLFISKLKFDNDKWISLTDLSPTAQRR